MPNNFVYCLLVISFQTMEGSFFSGAAKLEQHAKREVTCADSIVSYACHPNANFANRIF